MRGFFSKEKTQLKGGETKGFSCASCGLYKFALTPKMEPYGNFRKGIMVIGEAPGEDEDRRGRPWQGKTGRVLQRKYAELGVDLFEDCISLNAVACHPTNKRGANRTPTDHEINCCRQKVLNAVQKYKPRVIILQGGAALTSLIGHRWKHSLGGITKWAGWTIPDRTFGAWLCPTFHPSYIERQDEASEIDVLWQGHLKQAFAKAAEPFPEFRPEEDCVEITPDIGRVLRTLIRLKPLFMAFDIETTGLKPFNRAIHEIVCISFCASPHHAYAIPMPKEEKHLRMLRKLLESPTIGKIAANIKYEDTWLQICNGIQVATWGFDTMLASHVLDNRQGITGLKFQAYVQFGLLGYDEEVEPYLKARGNNANAPNRIMELWRDPIGRHKLQLYNGIDSLVTYRLARRQMDALNKEELDKTIREWGRAKA